LVPTAFHEKFDVLNDRRVIIDFRESGVADVSAIGYKRPDGTLPTSKEKAAPEELE